jgi:CheY-like chemotaxis protein
VLNSRDAMPDGGTITIVVDERTGADGEDFVAVTVADNGVGMDAETFERCREPFFTTKARSHSTGLGLATVTSIMQSVGGSLAIQSTEGKGTAITALFPRVLGAVTSPDGDVPSRMARVLIVDDDEGVRSLAERILAEAGFLVTAVGDAEAALVRAEVDGDFDLLLSDIVLRGMRGVGLARTFMQRWPATARLLMTGFAGRDSGTGEVVDTAVVLKPFSPEDLVRAAHAALEQRAQTPKR